MATPTREATDAELARVYAERDALQQRLTAADERADVLEVLLLQTNELLYAIQGDPGAVPSSAIDAMRGKVFTALKQAEGGGDEYLKSCEAAHKALSMEKQRIVVPGQFKCVACGDIHPGSGNLPCPKMSPTC